MKAWCGSGLVIFFVNHFFRTGRAVTLNDLYKVLGIDGIVFENCKFDNEMIEIDTDSSVTFLGMEEQKEEKNKVRIQELLQKRKQRENKL